MKKIRLIPFKLDNFVDKAEQVPYGVKMINAPTMWSQGFRGQGVVVAIIDSGCDINHQDLKHRIIGGYNFTKDYNNNQNKFSDNNGHGTHVAGIVAASANGSGIIGVSPEAELLILKAISGNGVGEHEDVIRAVEYTINWRGPREEKVRIISMSLGMAEDVTELHEVIKKAVDHDILVICSAGNSGDGNINTSEIQYPACYPEVVEVGAVDKNQELASFSSTNNQVDIVAPGLGILSTYPGGKYAELSGTSMATPHVSGAVALLISKYEEEDIILTVSEVYDLLFQHAKWIEHDITGEGFRLIDLSIYKN